MVTRFERIYKEIKKDIVEEYSPDNVSSAFGYFI